LTALKKLRTHRKGAKDAKKFKIRVNIIYVDPKEHKDAQK